MKSGAGTWTFSGAATHTGATTINQGTLVLSGTLGASSAVSVADGATLRLGTSGSLASSTAASVAAGATLDLNGRNQEVSVLNGAGAVALGSGQLTVSGTGDSTFEGTLAGTGSLVKSGSGILNLFGSVSHTGGTTVSAGTLALGSSDLLSGAVTLSGTATLDLGFSDQTVGALTLSGGTVAGIGTLNGASVTVNNSSGTVVVESSLASAGVLVKSGAGTLDLRSVATIAGGVQVTGGVLSVANGGSFGTTVDVTLSGGTLDLDLASLEVGSFNLVSGSLLGAGVLTAGSFDIAAASGNLTIAAQLAGEGALTKTGAGNLVLTGSNSFSGGFIIDAGTVTTNSLASLGSGSVDLGASTLLRLDLAEGSELAGSDLASISGAGVLEIGVGSTGSAILTQLEGFAGTIRLTSGTFDATDFTGSVVLAGGNLLNAGSFTGSAVITGNVTDISQLPTGGTLILESGASIDFGSTAFSGAITYRGGSVSGEGFTGTLNVQGSNVDVSGSFGNGKLSVGAGNSVVLSGATTGTLVFAGGSITGGANLEGTLELLSLIHI